MPFWPLVTLTFDLDIQTYPSEGPKRRPCEFGANPFSGSRDIAGQRSSAALLKSIGKWKI